MNNKNLAETAKAIVSTGRGVLAADDDDKEMFSRFAALGIRASTPALHEYWELLFTAPKMTDYISGVILCEEALTLRRSGGITYPEDFSRRGLLTGIVVDTGTKPLASASGEEITRGMDGLHDRLKLYVENGVQFTKWRAVIAIGPEKPSAYCIEANALELARFASLSQSYGMVPFVEPDVLIDGSHPIERCAEVTRETLSIVFRALKTLGVDLAGIILKPNMVLPGRNHPASGNAAQVASATLDVLHGTVPNIVPGIAFLSGGQSDQAATANLNEINAVGRTAPWKLTFCFGRALQTRALATWNGSTKNIGAAQEAFLHRAKLNSLAQQGRYQARMETDIPIEQPSMLPA